MSWTRANGIAALTKSTNDSFSSYLWMMVTATSVEAEPIGVMLPPRLAPKMSDHQNGDSGDRSIPPRIFANIAASGILSVTELATAAATISAAGPAISPSARIGVNRSPISSSTRACSIMLITMNRPPKNASRSQSIA